MAYRCSTSGETRVERRKRERELKDTERNIRTYIPLRIWKPIIKRTVLLFFFLITPIHTTSFISFIKNLLKKKKPERQNKSCIGSVRPQLGIGFLNLVISPHWHQNGGRSPNVGLGSFGQRNSRDGVVGAGQLGRFQWSFAHPYFDMPWTCIWYDHALMHRCYGAKRQVRWVMHSHGHAHGFTLRMSVNMLGWTMCSWSLDAYNMVFDLNMSILCLGCDIFLFVCYLQYDEMHDRC